MEPQFTFAVNVTLPQADQFFTLVLGEFSRLQTNLAKLQGSIDQLTQKETQIMPGIADIQTAQAAEKADLALLMTLNTKLLAAFASGAMTPAQAQSVLDEVTAEDATVKTGISAIQSALPAAPAPAPAAP